MEAERNRAMHYYAHRGEARSIKIKSKATPTSRKQIRMLRRKKAPILKYVGENKVKFSSYTFVTLILLFLCSLGLALSFAFVADKKNELASLRTQLKKQEDTNASLAAEISQKYDINEIRQIATTRLGMSEPKSHQIVHINVPKPSFSMQQYDNEDLIEQKRSLFAMILDFFSINIYKRLG